jgi:hypothetical protein
MMILWNDQADLYGITVKAYFFDADVVQRETSLPRRALPFLASMPPKTMFTEQDRQNFYYGELVAQPDAVFEHGGGLIAVEYKSVGGRPHSRTKWRTEIRLKDMLQCLAAGYAVAQTYQKPTACVLRYHNVCYLLSPEPGVITTMLDLIPMARQYHGGELRIAASQIAQFAQDRVRASYPGPVDERQEQGRAAHDAMLKR